MPVAAKITLRPLTSEETCELERLTRATRARVDQVRRARALLAVAAGASFAAPAQRSGYRCGAAVSRLVERFQQHGLGVLDIAPGRGRKPTYPAAARQRILAMVQRPPDREQDGTATWSLWTLQQSVRAADPAFARLGATTIRRVLHEAGYSDQRTRTWCPTGTAQRVRKAGVVTVYDGAAEEKKRLMEQAYQLGEAVGLAVWCQDEAGPYQAIPQSGAHWRPHAQPAAQPHEYVHGGTAKLLTLLHPATGTVRAQGVPRTPNVIRHAWLKQELSAILAQLPPPPAQPGPAREGAFWLGEELHPAAPPLRLILIGDNLAGHYTPDLVIWLFAQGILPLDTPLSGSWLNMAESVQRILVRRALAGTHPQTADEVITWLQATVRGGNRAPTPFIGKDKRYRRRQRARLRRIGGSGARTAYPHLIAA
jgi:transposase